jgi:hypothetical protein
MRNVVLLGLAILGCALATDSAWAYRRGRGGGGNNAARIAALKVQASMNIAAAQQALGVANVVGTKAQGKISNAQSMASAAVEQSKEAKDHLDGGHARLKEIETRVANNQQEGSEFNKALDALEDSRDEMTELREKIVKSRDYQRRYEKALAADDRSEAIAKVKKEMLDDNSDYAMKVSNYDRARVKFNNIFHKLLEEDPEWKSTVSDLREARTSSGESQGKLTSAGLDKMGAKQNLKKAAAVATEAKAVIAVNQAVLNSLPGNRNNKQAQQSKAPAKKK